MTPKRSVVVELQQKAMDSDVRISDVVRMALTVATKLDLEEFRNWCLKELEGYEDQDVPPYRRVQGELNAIHPARPPILVRFPDAEITQAFASQSVQQPIGELEALYKSSEESNSLEIPLSASVINRFFANTEKYREGFTPVVVISHAQLYGVLGFCKKCCSEMESQARGGWYPWRRTNLFTRREAKGREYYLQHPAVYGCSRRRPFVLHPDWRLQRNPR
jgi:hypothetical protein